MTFVENPSIDWSKIAADYAENIISNRAIARAHGLTEGAIRRRAKAENWGRVRRNGDVCVPGRMTLRTWATAIAAAVRGPSDRICISNDNPSVTDS